jgi:hypothetical protein
MIHPPLLFSRKPLACIALCAFTLLAGCNAEPPAVKPPDWDPAAQAAQAMTLYDKNTDGKIDSSEMSPGLKAGLSSIDTDSDKAISESEIAAKLQKFIDSKLGLIGVQGTISYSGRKIPGATVTFEPEPFLADVISPAKGTVTEDGFYMMQTEGQDSDAVQPGIYTVRISLTDSAGNEQISSRFNRESELGVVVEQENAQTRGAGQYSWRL